MHTNAQLPYRSGSPTPSAKGLYLAVLLSAGVLYGLTAQRGVSWQDSGMFQYRVFHGDLGLHGELGLALAHPLYILAGRLFAATWGWAVAARLNIFSGVGMAVALANLAMVGTILTGKRRVGVAVAGMLAVAHTPWWMATVAEVYTWSLAGFTAELWILVLLLRGPTWGKLAGLALVNGLGLCVHNFALLPLPVYVVTAVVLVVPKRLPAWSLLVAAAAYLAGSGLYLGMIAAKAAELSSVTEAVRSALVGRYGAQVVGRLSRARIGANFALVALNFANILLPLAVVGLWCLRRRVGRGTAWALYALAAIQTAFAVRYFVPDQFTFFLPTYAMITVLAAVGMDVLISNGRAWRRAAWIGVAMSIVAMPVLYTFGPAIAARVAPSAMRRSRVLPYRDEARYWITPYKQNEHSAQRFATTVLKEVPPNAIIVAASTSYYPLAVIQQTTCLGRGVLLLGGDEHWSIPDPSRDIHAFFQAVGNRPLYVVSPRKGYCPAALRKAATFRKEGLLHRATRVQRSSYPP